MPLKNAQRSFLKAKELRRQKALRAVEDSHLPFSKDRVPTNKHHLRRCISAETSEWKGKNTFKASAIPLAIYFPPYKNEHLVSIRAKERAERSSNLLKSSRSPPGLQVYFFSSTKAVLTCLIILQYKWLVILVNHWF